MVNELSYQIINSAIEVNKEMGPGLLESIYEACLVEELKSRGISFKQQVKLPIVYKGKAIRKNYYLDLLVEELVIVELKAVDFLDNIFQAQLLSYMKLMKVPKGLLINFNVTNITHTSIPLVNEHFSSLKD
jgi:GxxExxY protein